MEHAAGVTVPAIPDCPAVGSSGLGAAGAGPLYHGDLNCDSKVNALDALAVLRAVTGDYTSIGC